MIEFPKIICLLCRSLKSKNQIEREQTRGIICEIAKITGPFFAHFIIREMKQVLGQGWEGHILNYSVYQLLRTLDSQGLRSGSLDYCLGEILPLMSNEIFGKLHQEKSLDIGNRIVELKKNKAIECILIISKNINIDASVTYFIKFLKSELHSNLDSSTNL